MDETDRIHAVPARDEALGAPGAPATDAKLSHAADVEDGAEQRTLKASRSPSTNDGHEKDEVADEKKGLKGVAHSRLTLDTGETRLHIRQHWWQLWRSKSVHPPPASLDDAALIPLATCSIFGVLSYSWLTDIMHLGYARTLQATDLWKLDDSRSAGTLSAKLDASWTRRTAAADAYNQRLAAGEIKPSAWQRTQWSLTGHRAKKEVAWREHDGRQTPSLAWALNDVFGWAFWSAGLFKVVGDTSQLMAPLVIRTLIRYAQAHGHGDTANIGSGVGMAIGLFLLTVTASVCQHQFFWRSMTTGVLARAALIASLYKRGVHLTPKARTQIPHAALVNHISTDVSRIDAAAQWFHAGWTAPIQVSICLIILCVQLGPSALAGFSLFALMMPVQMKIMSGQFTLRQGSMQWTDKRARLLTEVLGSMRIVKYFTYEAPFLRRIFDIRRNELRGIRRIQFLRSTNLALAFAVPVLAATIAFVVYSAVTSKFDVAVVFSSLSLFNMLRQPLMLLPRALAGISDGRNAFDRLQRVFEAPIREGAAFAVDPTQEAALIVEGATFEWEETLAEKERREAQAAKKGKKGKRAEPKEKPAEEKQRAEEKPFMVDNVSFSVRKGELVAIVGPVGCGKSSLLQGLIGEMRKVSGNVTFGGRVAYCPQTAWISNNTLRENILFGAPFDEARYWAALETACLLPDLALLADGDLTEIGERGINLSGGQKQRVNIARALYTDADVVLFDDPLSAVDAHVGKALFADAIIGALRDRGKAVLLVTHALHFLSQCDTVYTLAGGRIAERGTYAALAAAGGEFARLDAEFGGAAAQEGEDGEEERKEVEVAKGDAGKAKEESRRRAGAGTGKLEGRLIINEKRTTGSVGWTIYWEYLKAARGAITGPLLVLTLILMQASLTLNAYALVWWENNTFHKSQGFYQAIYGSLGVSQAIWTFFVGVVMDYMSSFVSSNLHHKSVTNIFRAPMSFFDTTPMGRILSVFGKDIDTIDDQLAVSMRMFAIVIANVVGALVLITVVEKYFIIAAFCIFFGYSYFAAFYRASAREVKRLDAMLRSLLYGHFSESLTGLPTIRSYGAIDRFVGENAYYIDLENRALFLSVTNQRWLAIRLDFMGALMIFVVAMLAVVDVSGINPAEIGLVLSYASQLTQQCGMLTRQSAEVENYMNSVERVVHYARGDLIAQEAPHERPETRPAPAWPAHGAIRMRDVRMAYRPDLPDVIRGISLDIRGGEKIGVVGRTGAGKSSLMLALFRIIELKSGSITIDDIDISTLGLRDLRSRISIIPQDPLLFSGTIRSNLDPFGLYEDAALWDALRRAYLVGEGPDARRFTLESSVESEGANLSQGERSLLSIARALVKDSKVVILDEATASVDLATDSKIQETIQAEFADRTLLCIAHRLRTILAYDRILALDAGTVVEFASPESLFAQRGVFWSLCERSKITLDEIHKANRR